MKKIPEFLRKYFWEVRFEGLDLRKCRIYVLKRILEYGDERAVAWLWKNFEKSEIKNVLINYRSLSQKSANYWTVVLGLSRGKVRCLNKPLPKEQKRIWPY
jgi:hypothetical protein